MSKPKRPDAVPATAEDARAARRHRKCVCGIPPDKVTGTSQAIVSAYRGEDPSTICPACGRERLVLKLAFPRDGAF